MTPAKRETPGVFYETPILGVYVQQNGELHHGMLDDQAVHTVRSFEALGELSGRSALPHAGLLIGQVPVTTLSASGGGDLAGALGISAELADTLKLAAQAISVISVAGTVVSVAISAMQWLGIFGEDANPYDEQYERIEQRLRGMLQTTLAGQTLQTMQQMNMLIGHAETAGQAAGAYLLNHTPARQALLPQADYWSQYAVNTLRGEALWLRTYDADTAPLPAGGSSGWEFGPTVRADQLTWDWRLPLLA